MRDGNGLSSEPVCSQAGRKCSGPSTLWQCGLIAAMVACVTTVAMGQQPPTAPLAPSTLYAIDPKTPEGLRQLLSHTSGETLPLVSAHRGGAQAGLPENCIATFENTLRHTFAMLEIDPRYTRDGQIVVHHDPTLDRTTTGTGRLADHDWSEVQKLQLKDPAGNVTEHRVPTLDEVLEWARGKTVLVLDQKDVPVKARVEKIEQHDAEAFAMLIVYSFEEARQCYELNKDIMMEVMITDRRHFEQFERSGVPWANVLAFVGHQPPRDLELLQMIHAKGACCLAGTSRNLDRELLRAGDDATRAELRTRYRQLLDRGVDLIEADLAVDVARLLYTDARIPPSKADFFRKPNGR